MNIGDYYACRRLIAFAHDWENTTIAFPVSQAFKLLLFFSLVIARPIRYHYKAMGDFK